VRIRTKPKGRRSIAQGFTPGDFEQAADDGIEFAVQLIQPPKAGDGALLDPTGVVPIGLDELDVAAAS
jgi:hypothetical protein